MKAFAALFTALDGTTKTGEKTAVLATYFRTAPDADKVWAIALLSGRRPRRAVTTTELRLWAAEAAGIPEWLFAESYVITGDLAETIAAVLPPPVGTGTATGAGSLSDTVARLISLTGKPADSRRAAVLAVWASLPQVERFLFNKLLTGGFRIGVAQGLLTRALAVATGVEEATLAHRLMGDWTPARATFASLIGGDAGGDVRPYPFALASPLEAPPGTLGPPDDWIAEWKWDGIRGQLICRPGAFALWSRGEELITDRFPEFAALADFLPSGTVIDGEILVWGDDRPLPFAALQKRIGRKTVPRKLLAEAPARFLAYDLMEADGQDIRDDPLTTRRARLAAMISALPPGLPLALSPALAFADWTALEATRAGARDAHAEGLMLKRGQSAYHTGRRRGGWWKWKLDPYSIDAVMLYAQAGHGRRATLFTDFTFGIRDGNDLVPFTKAYSGLTDAEFALITTWVQAHTLERFGPVRKVPAELVFEIAFEGIQHSPRHKSGIALRFPRMVRWRRDKGVADIDTIETLRAFLRQPPGASPPDPEDI